MILHSNSALLLILLISIYVTITGERDSEPKISTTSNGSIEGIVQLSPKKRVIRNIGGLYGRPTQSSSSSETSDSVLVVLTGTSITSEGHHSVTFLNQQDRRFIPDLLPVYPGQTVRIQNSDPVYHNVFSLTRPHKFDVGRRPKGEFFDIAFDEPGVIDVFCDIHSNMYAIIYVLPPGTIAWTKIRSGEPFHFTDIPNGTYQIFSYAKGYQERITPVKVSDNKVSQIGQIILEP